jgi:hypothetical protein
MPDDLTDTQVALLCEIGELEPSGLSSDQTRDLELLVFGGYLELADSGARKAFTLTAKALEFLGKRGVGLNEA